MLECAVLPASATTQIDPDESIDDMPMRLKMLQTNVMDDNHNPIQTKTNSSRFSFPAQHHAAHNNKIVERRGGVVYNEDSQDDKDNHNNQDLEPNSHGHHRHHHQKIPITLIHPKHLEIRSKSILKVKSLEDSLRSCSTTDDDDDDDDYNVGLKRRCRSSSYGRMMMKLQSIRRRSNNRTNCHNKAREKECQEQMEALSITSDSRETSILSEQEAIYQAQQQQQEQNEQEHELQEQDQQELQHHQAGFNDHDDTACDNEHPQDSLSACIASKEVDCSDLPCQEALPRHISFSTISIRSYYMTIDDNPSVSSGPAIGLSWNFEELPALNVEQYEQEKQTTINNTGMVFGDAGSSFSSSSSSSSTARSVERPMEDLRLSLEERQRLLQQLGLPQREVKAYLRRMESSRKQRLRAIAAEQRRVQHSLRSSSAASRRNRRRKRRTTKSEWNLVVLDMGNRRRNGQRASLSSSSTPPPLPLMATSSVSSRQQHTSPHHTSFLPFKINWKPSICKTDDEQQDELWDRAQRQDREHGGGGGLFHWSRNWFSSSSSSSSSSSART